MHRTEPKMNPPIETITGITIGALAYTALGYLGSAKLTNASRWIHENTDGWLEYYVAWAMLVTFSPLLLEQEIARKLAAHHKKAKLAYLKHKYEYNQYDNPKAWFYDQTWMHGDNWAVNTEKTFTLLALLIAGPPLITWEWLKWAKRKLKNQAHGPKHDYHQLTKEREKEIDKTLYLMLKEKMEKQEAEK
jgi:hypothetical protein